MVLNKLLIGISLFFLGWNAAIAQESYNRLIFEGNRSFKEKNYDGSAAKFKDAAQLKKTDFAAHYNLGNAYYKKKMYEEAQTQFQKAQGLAKTKADKAAALYNLGNSYMQKNSPEKAAEYYKQSLKLDPYNESIRKNYEIAKRKDKENQDQQNQNQENKNGGGKNDQQKDQSKNDPNGKNPQQNGNGQTPEQKGDGNNKSQNPKDSDGSMPKDLQDAILNRVSNKERETARRILNKNSYSTPESNDKDW